MPRDGSLPPGCNDLVDTLENVRVIGKTGNQLGIMTLAEAIRIADAEHAEMVNIAPSAKPPIYRLIAADEYRKIKEKRGKKL
jgi:translation initiation factor IF-3